jgi:light-regulated signal transduction histidine kinase (bacteriophytochrome)
MQKMLKEVVNDITMQEKDRKIEIKINTLSPCTADPSMIRQVWINLVGNAFKYSKKKESAHIEIGSYPENGSICYYVKDNGTGFDMKYINKLFNVFQRLHSMNDFEGTGVGLALVKRIVTRHGGIVWAEGKTDEGATFYFSLPDHPVREQI